MKSYDIKSFEIGVAHKCLGTDINIYEINNTIKKIQTPAKCKLHKISDNRGNPIFHFEINGKVYFYGTRGVRTDGKIGLRCSKKILNLKKACCNSAYILPSAKGKVILQDTPTGLKRKFSKYLNKSDPRVYDLDNYDINSFEICGNHECSGTEFDVYLEKLERKKNLKK